MMFLESDSQIIQLTPPKNPVSSRLSDSASVMPNYLARLSPILIFFLACFLAVKSSPVIGQDSSVATNTPGTTPKRVVVSTIGMITDIVKAVGGDSISVTGLMGPGTDPHLYKATRSDIAILSSADIVFYNGLLLEGKLTDALTRMKEAGRQVFPVTELISNSELRELEDFSGHYDPHVWMDPRIWAKTIPVIAEKLSQAQPSLRDRYTKAAEVYRKKVEDLDKYAERVLSTVPPQSRVLITAHDAFSYFGRRYGYEVRGIQGLSTESEAGVQDIERLVSDIVSRKIKAVFVESTVPTRSILALIEGATAQGHTVSVGGQLFSDAMGPAGTYEGSYLGMIDHNVTTITRALGGDAPRGGMNGSLSEIGKGNVTIHPVSKGGLFGGN